MERGTFSDQRTITGTLGTIVDIARQQSLRSPAVIIIGAVAGLVADVAWQPASILAHKRIALGEIAERIPDLGAYLTAMGALVLNLPNDAHQLYAESEGLDAVVVASVDEARLLTPGAGLCPCKLVCVDEVVATMLESSDLPYVQIDAESGRDFAKQLEAVLAEPKAG